jgi:hypothetical protein
MQIDILGPMIRKIKNLILSYRDTILALKASGVSISTLSGATCSRFQSRTVLGKNDHRAQNGHINQQHEDHSYINIYNQHKENKEK